MTPAPGREEPAGPAGLPQPVTASSLHLLRHPDRRTTWSAASVLHFAQPLGHNEAEVRAVLAERFAVLLERLPLAGARLRDTQWIPAPPNPVEFFAPDDPVPPVALRRFDLAHEAPLRILAALDGSWVTSIGHHAAFDGSNGFSIGRAMAGLEDRPLPHRRVLQRRSLPIWDPLRRVLRPADPVARSAVAPTGETVAVTPLPRVGRGMTTRLPEACVAAVVAHNRRAGRPCRRVGISLGLVAQHGDTDVSTYRRLDQTLGQDLGPAIEAALASTEEPWEIAHAPRALKLLAPLVGRLSDTLLVSNFGRAELPGVRQMDIYPVAHGRSALAFGAVRMAGGDSTLTLRSLTLSPDDARRLLDETVEALTNG